MIYVEDAETGEVIFVDTDDPGSSGGCAPARTSGRPPWSRICARPGWTCSRCPPTRTWCGRCSGSPSCAGGGDELRLAVDAARPRSPSRCVGAVVPAAAARPRGPARRAGRARPGRAGRGDHRAGGGTLPPALLLVALVLLLTALARPEATVPQPRREGTVILAFDVSASMAATDLAADPDGGGEGRRPRLRGAAAGDRAGRRGGVQRERAGHPGADRRPGRRARGDRPARPQGGTALGARPADLARAPSSGQPVLVDAPSAAGSSRRARTSATTARRRSSCSPTARTPAEPDPLDVAELASSAGVRVYPIGLGRPEGTVLEIDGFQVATALDEPLLREIAARTDGRYFAAADEQALAAVYDAIELAWTVRDRAHRADRAVRRRGRAAAARWASGCRWRGSGGRCSHGLRVAARAAVAARGAAAGRWLRLAAAPAPPAGGAVLERRADPGGGPAALGVAAARAVRAAAGGARAPRRGGGPPAGQRGRPGLGVGDDPGARRVGLDVRDRRAAQPAHRGPGGGARVRAGPGRRAPASGWCCSPASRRSRWPRRPTGSRCCAPSTR